MALTGPARLIAAETSRTLLYLSQKVASDSAFPFAPGERLIATIDPENHRLIIERGREDEGIKGEATGPKGRSGRTQSSKEAPERKSTRRTRRE